MSRNSRQQHDTYVYIDVSNIRLACLKTLGVSIDFVKLLAYFKRRYQNIKDIRYYEGIANDDVKKRRMFDFLERKGYTICELERKSYRSTETEEREVRCPRCSYEWTEKLNREHKAMKSNVDVYLASDMVAQASRISRPTNLILVSCDGDYAEAIKTILELNPKVSVSVLATPLVKSRNRNTLSTRLRKLAAVVPNTRFTLLNIRDICDVIANS